jgi:hypothetical protein
MQQQFDRELTGIISKNERKLKDTHPEYTGNATVGGIDYFVDGWINQRKDGSGSFLKLKFKAKDKQSNGDGGGGYSARPVRSPIVDDDIPF